MPIVSWNCMIRKNLIFNFYWWQLMFNCDFSMYISWPWIPSWFLVELWTCIWKKLHHEHLSNTHQIQVADPGFLADPAQAPAPCQFKGTYIECKSIISPPHAPHRHIFPYHDLKPIFRFLRHLACLFLPFHVFFLNFTKFSIFPPHGPQRGGYFAKYIALLFS